MININPETAARRRILTEKLKTRQMNRNEAEELKKILESEKTTALSLGDALAILGIGFLLALVIDYLTKDSD